MRKQVETEATRTNVTPKIFYNYCKKRIESIRLDIEEWVSYEEWLNPSSKCNHWHKSEVCKMMPLDYHMANGTIYNFIMEFEYNGDGTNRGVGYMYIKE